MKKIISLILMAIFIFTLFSTSFATIEHTYCTSYTYQNSLRGLKGDFKLPYLDSFWSTSKPTNFITFEEWLPVNGTTGDWFEIGYMDGAIDPEKDGIISDYRGFFKAKRINGVYWEDRLIKTATVGTRYTFTIVDYGSNNIWSIYIGSTYFGTFSSSVGPAINSYARPTTGYEINLNTNTNPIVSSTDITNLKYTTGALWWPLYCTAPVYISDNTNLLNASYSSSYNKTNFYKQ